VVGIVKGWMQQYPAVFESDVEVADIIAKTYPGQGNFIAGERLRDLFPGLAFFELAIVFAHGFAERLVLAPVLVIVVGPVDLDFELGQQQVVVVGDRAGAVDHVAADIQPIHYLLQLARRLNLVVVAEKQRTHRIQPFEPAQAVDVDEYLRGEIGIGQGLDAPARILGFIVKLDIDIEEPAKQAEHNQRQQRHDGESIAAHR
jgi:hypothetical protein